MAKFTGWVGRGDGSGLAIDTEGNIQQFNQKPPESDFVPKPEGAPEGDFIQTPAGEFAPRLGAPGGQARTEFLGELTDRRNLIERAAAARLGARMGAKKKLDKQGLRLGYTPVQERMRSALRESRAKLEQEWADKKWTEDQMFQLESQLFLKEQAIMPQMIKQPPTPQEQFQQSLVQDQVTGIRYTRKNNGDYSPLSGGLSATDRMKLAKIAVEAIEAEAIAWDKENKPTRFKVATAEEVNAWITDFTTNDAQIDAAKSGIPTTGPAFPEGPPRRRGERPQPMDQLKSMGVSDATIEAAKREGKTEEDILRDMQELAKTGKITTAPTDSRFKTWEELSEKQQTEVIAKFEKEEKIRRSKTKDVLARFPERFKPMSKSQFLEEVKADPEFLQTFIKVRKKGTLPQTWAEATETEQKAMYAAFKEGLSPGDPIKSFFEFSRQMEQQPEQIKVLLKKPKKKK